MASIEKEQAQVTEPETQVKEEAPVVEVNAPSPTPPPPVQEAPTKKKKQLTGKALENHKKATAARLQILRKAKHTPFFRRGAGKTILKNLLGF